MNPTEEFSTVQKTSEDFRDVQKSSEEFRTLHNTSENFNTPPTPADEFRPLLNTAGRASGIGRGKKYAGADAPDHDYNGDDFMIMEEAYLRFEQEGERRSVRMIAEYCKNGELVCIYDSDDKRWHITRESVQNKITKIKALNARKVQSTSQHSEPPVSEAPAPPPAKTEPAAREPEQEGGLLQKLKALRHKYFDLRVANQAKDMLIETLNAERAQFITRIEDNSRLIGQLETKLLQLEAPRREGAHDATLAPVVRDVDYADRGGGATAPQPAPPPEARVNSDHNASGFTSDPNHMP